MFPTTLLTTLFFALSVAASPVLVNRSLVTLPLTRLVNLTSLHDLVLHDQARAKALIAKVIAKATGLPLHNEPVVNQAVSYTASVGVGSPPTTYSLIIDTGSSNIWVGANAPYVKTSTSVQTSNSVSVTYGSASFSGTEYTDTITLTAGLVIPEQSIGVASKSTGFATTVDGIIGIGPVALTQGKLSPDTDALIPTVTDNLFANGDIPCNEIGISFEPTNTLENLNGELTWGGTDRTKYTGEITYIPITTTSPASHYWGIDQSVRYGDSLSILDTTAGIVDTGTTLILIATNGLTKYQSATGAVLDSATGLLRITSAQYSALKSLFFTAGGTTFELTPNAQIWPRSLNTFLGGTADSIYLVVSDLGTNTGQGLDFLSGQTFLERFYSVYDTGKQRVGLATTPFTNAVTN